MLHAEAIDPFGTEDNGVVRLKVEIEEEVLGGKTAAAHSRVTRHPHLQKVGCQRDTHVEHRSDAQDIAVEHDSRACWIRVDGDGGFLHLDDRQPVTAKTVARAGAGLGIGDERVITPDRALLLAGVGEPQREGSNVFLRRAYNVGFGHELIAHHVLQVLIAEKLLKHLARHR